MSALNLSVHLNAVAPYALKYIVTASDPTIDLSTVSAASFHIRKVDGTTTTWTANIETQSIIALTLVHTFASGDVATPGIMYVEPHMTTPAGDLLAEPGALRVREAFT